MSKQDLLLDSVAKFPQDFSFFACPIIDGASQRIARLDCKASGLRSSGRSADLVAPRFERGERLSRRCLNFAFMWLILNGRIKALCTRSDRTLRTSRYGHS